MSRNCQRWGGRLLDPPGHLEAHILRRVSGGGQVGPFRFRDLRGAIDDEADVARPQVADVLRLVGAALVDLGGAMGEVQNEDQVRCVVALLEPSHQLKMQA
eukprot:6189981-Alexandrium_andersonii.AAC.1